MTDAAPPNLRLYAEPNAISIVTPTILTIANVVSIDLKTKKVTLSPGVSDDEAARRFWLAVESMGVKICGERAP